MCIVSIAPGGRRFRPAVFVPNCPSHPSFRRRAEKEHRMSIVTILRDFLDGLEEGVLFLDAGRRVIDMNRAAARTLGWHEKLVLDQLCPSLFPGTACARECERSGRCSLTPKLSEDGKIQDIVVATRDGRSIPVRMWAMLLPPNDGGLFARSSCVIDRMRSNSRVESGIGGSLAI
jgi:PAS domain-containing protein